jgi:hexosaminidase
LLPQPKELSSLDGAFSLNTDTLIIIPAQAGDDAFFAARQLQNEMCRATCLTLPIVKAFAPLRQENVFLLACGPEQAAAFGLEPVAISAPEAVTAQSYALTITPARITLYANTPTGLFYAIQTLRQLIRLHYNPSLSCHPSSQAQTLPALTIQDWPTLPYRGLMLDVSRRKVPTLATLKQLAEELSHYKLNVLQLWTVSAVLATSN